MVQVKWAGLVFYRITAKPSLHWRSIIGKNANNSDCGFACIGSWCSVVQQIEAILFIVPLHKEPRQVQPQSLSLVLLAMMLRQCKQDLGQIIFLRSK
jgi:hypothetical protein